MQRSALSRLRNQQPPLEVLAMFDLKPHAAMALDHGGLPAVDYPRTPTISGDEVIAIKAPIDREDVV